LRTQLRHLLAASNRGICLRVVPERSVSSAEAYLPDIQRLDRFALSAADSRALLERLAATS
jgi:hypothetical protein